MPPTFNAAPKCAGGCGQAVYFAERTLGPGGTVFHKRCLKCINCGKVLDSGSVQDHDGAPFCKPCHSKSFGTRGYGISHAGLVGEYQPRPSSPPPSLSPSQPPPPPLTSSAVPSPAPASPAPTQPDLTDRTPLPAPTPPAAPSPTPQTRAIPPPVPKKPVIPPKPAFSNGGRTSLGVGPRTSLGGGGENCPRCGQVVYAAESVLASGSKWHKRCLRCAGCSTVLTGANLVEKNGEPWCAKCHTKNSLAEQGMMTRPGLF